MMSQLDAVQIPDTERHPLTSREGREYEILLARPGGTPPPGGFPAIDAAEGQQGPGETECSLRDFHSGWGLNY